MTYDTTTIDAVDLCRLWDTNGLLYTILFGVLVTLFNNFPHTKVH